MFRRSLFITVLVAALVVTLVPVASATAGVQYEFDRRVPDVSADHLWKAPCGVAVRGDYAYVADTGNHRVVKIRRDGLVVQQFGQEGSLDGQLFYPADVAVDAAGNVYVADTYNDRIEKFSATGSFVLSWGTSGSGAGQFSKPAALAVDGLGHVFVADTLNSRVQAFTSSGTFIRQWGTEGTATASFSGPKGIEVDAANNVYVADTGNDRIEVFDEAGTFVRSWGGLGSAAGLLNDPEGIAIDFAGRVCVADRTNNRIQRFDAYGAYVDSIGSAGSVAGRFRYPSGVAVSASGEVWVTDGGNDKVQLLASDGTSLGEWGACGDVPGLFREPYGVSTDASGNVYAIDRSNSRLEKFDAAGELLTSWGHWGSSAGEMITPTFVAADEFGNVYVSDTGNDRVEKFDSNGKFLLAFGSRGTGDGQFRAPTGVAVDESGTVYVVDNSNHRVEKFDSSGTFLGAWGTFGSGDGQLRYPYGIAAANGRVWVADTLNDRIAEFTTAGVFIANHGGFGYGEARFDNPYGIAVDPSGDIVVADTLNSRIQKFSPDWRFMVAWGSLGIGDEALSSPKGIAVDPSGRLWIANTGSHVLVAVDRDHTPPVTTISSIPEGWLHAPVTFSLSAGDVTFGSDGVAETWYRFRGHDAYRYEGPVTIDQEGLIAVEYWSVDIEGNVETPSAAFVRIDRTPPMTVGNVVTSADGTTTVELTAWDAVSGIAVTYWQLDGGSVGQGQRVPVVGGGHHVITMWSFDVAGNRETPTTMSFDVRAATALAVESTPSVVAYGKAGSITGTLTAGAYTAEGRQVRLESSANGIDFHATSLATTTAEAGRFTFAVAPTTKTYYRVVCDEQEGYSRSVSGAIAITPKAYLTPVSVARRVRSGAYFSVSGKLMPKHTNGLKSVKLTFYRYESGKWVSRKSVTMVNKGSATTYTSYSAKLRFTLKGKWRVRASHSDTGHASSYGSYRNFVIY